MWDARGHVMSSSNDSSARREIFEWIGEHDKTFYLPRRPINPIGIYFSPETRNYFPDAFLPSYQGILILLMQSHLEFQVVTPRTLAAFRGATLVLPDVRMIGEVERDALRAQISRGARLVVTGTDATGLAAETLTRFPECPGRAYLADLQKDFGKTDPSERADLLSALAPDSPVRVEASASVATQIARVDGKIHIFFASFKGLVAGRNAVQTAERRIRVTVPAANAGKAWFLPFLGEAQAVEGQRHDANLVFVLPDVQKGAVVWFE